VGSVFFFFQAEVGIRDGHVTGVQTCALPICYHSVVEDAEAHDGAVLPGMMISRRMLAQHLDWLGRRFRFASLDEVGERLISGNRSEEHTSELQSRGHLVCRLLLEKKKKKKTN